MSFRARIVLHVVALVGVLGLMLVALMSMGGADTAERLTLVALAVTISLAWTLWRSSADRRRTRNLTER